MALVKVGAADAAASGLGDARLRSAMTRWPCAMWRANFTPSTASAPTPAARWGRRARRLHSGCPFHGWEFDCRTGANDGDEDLKLATYPVKVEGGEILVELP